MDFLTTAEAAALRWPQPDDPAKVRRWLTAAASHLHRHGVQPLPGRTDTGMRMWPALLATTVMTAPARRGNYTSGPARRGRRKDR